MNLDFTIVMQFLLSFWVWAFLGLERWINNNNRNIDIKSFWEMRTFAFISLLWALSTFIAIHLQTSIFIVIAFLALAVFVFAYYLYSVFKKHQFGMTTEIIGVITFFLWVIIMIGHWYLALVLTIIIAFFLSNKNFFAKFNDEISFEELSNTIKFAIIALVVLPLLPDKKYSILDLLSFIGFEGNFDFSVVTTPFFNPYGIWFFVVLMSGISYVWYIMSKFIWQKGSILASGAIWWLISSTAVTASMTENSKKDAKNIDMYVVSTLLASTIMFIRVVIIVLFFNIKLLSEIFFPSFCMLVWMVIYMYYFYNKWKKQGETGSKKSSLKEKLVWKLNKEKKVVENFESPFSVWPAIKFAGFVLVIKFISAIWWVYKDIWWDYFFYALWVISGLADVDAISQTMAVDSKWAQIWASIAVTTIIIAIISNNLVKWWIAFRFGEKRFWKSVMLWFLFSMIMGIAWIVLMKFI